MKAALPICVVALLVVGSTSAAVMGSTSGARPGSSEPSTWSVPVNLGPALNTAFTDGGPTISEDGLTLFFGSRRPGGAGLNDVWVTHRANLGDPWEPPMNVGAPVNTPWIDQAPSLSRDGHWLFFNSNRPGGFGLNDIWVSHRDDVLDNFGWQAPVNLGPGVNTASIDQGASHFENKSGVPMLFFGSNRPGGLGLSDIYVSAQLPDGSFGPAARVTELSSPYQDHRPVVRFDGLEVFLFSDRPPSELGDYDIWTSTRTSVFDTWTPPVNLGAPVNTDRPDQQAWLASDRRTLYFSSSRPGGFGGLDLYVTTRPNRVPEPHAGRPVVGLEGSPTMFDASDSRDPDGDPLEFRWDFTADGTWDTGWSSSPTATHTYGDDWTGRACLEVSDGSLTDIDCAAVTVNDIGPTIQFTAIPTGDEAQSLEFRVRVTDPGSDDLAIEWSGRCTGWSPAAVYPNNPGIVPDPYPSPDVNPRDVTDVQWVVCGDDGKYDWNVRIEDDDGGVATMIGAFAVDNLPPSLTVSPPARVAVDEGMLVSLSASAEDPGSDDLTFTWSWQYGPTEIRTYYNDGVGPDQPDSPNGTLPFTVTDQSSHTYGDDCTCVVTLTVEDDDAGILAYSTTVDVVNVPPSLTAQVTATAIVDVTLRMAGEKWHDVTPTLYDGGVEVVTASVIRVPGSPDDQEVTIDDVSIDVRSGAWSAVIAFTPLDDPVNGQVWGANPAWLIFTGEDGSQTRLHHTFNVRHEETWTWVVEDLRVGLVGLPIRFAASASDVGSDDLTVTWDFGDGGTATATYFNNGVSPDPFPSPEVNPMTATDLTTHAFVAAGTYPIKLTVTDDDGGIARATFTMTIGA